MGASPILGLPDDREEGDQNPPSDHNALVDYDENSVARVLLHFLAEDGLINRDVIVCTIDEATGRIAAPPADEPIIGLLYGRGFYMGSDMEAGGTATGGTTTSLTTNSLVQGDDFWNGARVVFQTGANAGRVRLVDDYALVTGTLEWEDALPVAVQAGDTFTVTFFYIQDLTVNALNYVFGRVSGRTTRDGIIQWVASTSSAKLTGDILVATLSLDAGGAVVSSNNTPAGCDRNLWVGMGAVHQLEFEGELVGLAPGAYTDFYVPHSALILLGPVEFSVQTEGASYEILECCEGARFKARVTNDTSYAGTVEYSGVRWGRKKVEL